MQRYLIFVMIILVFSITQPPINTAQADKPLSDYPIITAENVSQLEQLKVLGEGYIRHVIFSPDEQFVAMASSVGIWLYSADDLDKPIHLFGNYDIDVTYAMFSADGSRLFGGVQGGSVYIWDVASGELLVTLQAVESEWGLGMLGMELSDDEQLLYIIHDESLNIWNLRNSEFEKTIVYKFACNGDYLHYTRQVFNPDKTYLLTSCYIEQPPMSQNTPKMNSRIHLIHIETGEIYPIEHERYITSIHFNDTGTRLIGVLRSGYFVIWDTESRTLLYEFGENRLGAGNRNSTYAKQIASSNYQSNEYAYSQYPEIGILTNDDSKFIELGSYGIIWDIQTNTNKSLFSIKDELTDDEPFNLYTAVELNNNIDRNEVEILIEEYDIINRIVFFYRYQNQFDYQLVTTYRSPKFKYLVGLGIYELLIWDLETNTLPFKIDLKTSCRYSNSAELGLDNTLLLSQQGSTTCIWDVESGDVLQQIASSTYMAISENFASTRISDGSENDIILLWDLRTDTYSEFPIQGYIEVSQLRTDEKFLVALVNNNQNGDVFVWDIETKSLITSFSFALGGWNRRLRISPDNNLLAAYNEANIRGAPDNDIYVWDTKTWTELYYIDKYYEEFFRCFKFSSQGNFLVISYTGDVEGTDLWDAKTGNLITTLPDTCAYFSDEDRIFNLDDSQLALYGNPINGQSTINIIDTTSFESIHTLNPGGIYEFSPVKNLLMVARDNIVQIWDTDSGLSVFSISLSSKIYDAKFNDAGNLILAEMQDGTVRIWGVNTP